MLSEDLYLDGEDADDEGSEIEEYGDNEDRNGVVEDPGPFKYNKRIFLISLPCFLLVLTLTGELLLCFVGIGVTMVSILHNNGEYERSLVVFMVSFLLSQMTILYTVIPLLWVSFWNIFLIGLINGYTVLTGCWLVIQLPSFRLQAKDSLQFIEKSLFSFYPVMCVMLWTWALCFVFISVKFAPYLFIVFSFVILQLFLIPSQTSFHIPNPVINDENIVDPILNGFILFGFCVGPSLMHIMLTIVHPSVTSNLYDSLIQEGFILAASIFLCTFLGVRKFIEYIGLPYNVVIKARWASGVVLAVTTSSLLKHFGAESPLLSWLHVVVAAYCCYGVTLSFKKYKLFSVGCICLLIFLHIYHVGWLPWKLNYYIPLLGIHISFVHILIVLNASVCLLFVFVATHGSPQLMGTLIVLQTCVFIGTEICLRLPGLYNFSLVIITGAMGAYLSLRLVQVYKIPWLPAWFSASCHVTKISVCCLQLVNSNLIGSEVILASVALYPTVAFILYIIMLEDKMVLSQKQVYGYVVVVYMISSVSVLSLGPGLWRNAFISDPCYTDLIGFGIILSGIIVFALSLAFFPPLPIVQSWGPFSILIGLLVFLLQPDSSNHLMMIEFWGTVLTVPCLYMVLFMEPFSSLKSIICLGCTLTFFPTAMLVSVVYSNTAWIGMFLVWYPAISLSASLYSLIYKGNLSVIDTEKYVLYLYIIALPVIGIGLVHSVISMMLILHQSAYVSLHIATAIITSLSLAGKLYSVKNKDLPRHLVYEHKLKTTLPVLSNGVCVLTFVLLCFCCPFEGFARDLWLVLSSSSLLCLQWDKMILVKFNSHNQTAPMLVVSLVFLLLSAIYNSAFWDFTLSLATARGFFEVVVILITVPGYLLFVLFLWTEKIVLSEKTVVFTAPLNLVLMLLCSSSASFFLGVSGLSMSIWLMGFRFTLKKDIGAIS